MNEANQLMHGLDTKVKYLILLSADQNDDALFLSLLDENVRDGRHFHSTYSSAFLISC